MSPPSMVQVESLTKRYGRHAAVVDASFEVAAGEVVGLLGPNGAGKSTIMRILSCFLPATSGTARVAGLDVFREADAVRRRIGYMPENNPLHTDMRVREYLRFRGRLKGLRGTRLASRVRDVMDQCGVAEVEHRIIGTLSKGFRQRVGLADALVHEPALIILDEPTIGLDPQQIRAVRDMIRGLGRERTILISSHILPEIEATCTRVLILQRGRILAADTLEHVRQRLSTGTRIRLEAAAPVEVLREYWDSRSDVERAECLPLEDGFVRCLLTPRHGADLRGEIFDAAVARGWRLRELTCRTQTLEEVYLRLTRAEPEAEES